MKSVLWKGVSLCLLVLSMTCIRMTTFAQAVVTGKVIDAKTSETIIGASVKVKNGTGGAITDANGIFKINAAAGAILQVSYIGYQPLEVPATSGTMVIKISPALNDLNEVVVVGYGTQKKATLTGSVATVGAKVFQDRGPLSNPLAALQGQVPGVAITRNSAQPGRESWNFLIRGSASTNSTEPLIVIDGVPVPSVSSLSTLNPADVDNISFLKDAAAAIYGSRAAGGVVLITTKKAKSGKAVISYNGSYSIKNVGLQPKLVDVNGWGPMILEARLNDGLGESDIWANLAKASIYAKQNGLDYLTQEQYKAAGFTGFTDVKDFPFYNGTMQDILWGNAASEEHQLSIAGRTDKAGYRISLGYLNDESLLQVGNNSNRRYNFRLNTDYQVSDRLKVEANFSLERSDIIQPANIGAVLNNGTQPGLPTAALNGRPYIWGSGIGNASPNSIADLGGDSKEYNTRFNTSANATYTISKDLKAVATVGFNYNDVDYRTNENVINFYDITGTILNSSLAPSSGSSRSFYQRVAKRQAYYTTNVFLEYNKTSGDHELKLLGGGQYERNENNSFLGRTMDVLNGIPPSLSLGTGDASSKSVSELQDHYALAGFFGRANYTYKSKYLLEASIRYDGSSRFIAANRWKPFFGVLGGWRIKEEDFLKGVDFVSDLKLRLSYGTAGNQSGIGLYDYINLLVLNSSQNAQASSFPIIGTAPVVRVSPGNLVALDRTWETVKTTNAGVDFGFLGGKLTGSFDYFLKYNSNMLIARAYPSVLGATAPAGNNGELRTTGWEFALNWNGKAGDLSYHIGGNIADYNNKLLKYGGQQLISSANRGFNDAVEGYALNTYFGLEYAGRIQTQEQLEAYRKLVPNNNINIPAGDGTNRSNSLQLGDNMYKDLNGDGKITFEGDAKALGTDDPHYIYSFNGGVNWKGFDMNFIFQGVAERTIIRQGNWTIPVGVVYQAQNAAFVDQWWTPSRTDAELPRLSSTGAINNYNYFPSDWVAQSGAYLRLKNVVVGYTLPQAMSQKIKIDRIRVYFSGNDLWESTKIRDGWDPEAPRTVNNTGDTANNNVSTFSQRYPFYRFYTFGLNLTF
ncbi:SusC/RagA family TonB-linked outer membrane protein [Pedobacter sp. AW31-3R]|uniref:SusC/RagA family TonB-linked outer membrane protein n=1 Tax=Pedobacter sp. AW31-3R TaxID=3445781 RepID=UPI003F9FEB51